MNSALLLLRLVTGLLVAGHGVQKISFRLGGKGLAGGVEEFRQDGFRGGRLTALAAGGTQVGAGLLLAAGALTPLAGAGVMGVMSVALTVKRPHGLWVQNDGYEYPLLLVAVPAALVLAGPGAWSLDALLGYTNWPLWPTAGCLALGPVSGLLTRLALYQTPSLTTHPRNAS
ncbi:DoxX family protein [Streptomyces sp. NPDC059651]|uniref:DoxX family protein n=1 Tax=Streptomyces sp. NPDC059651 TaxID=3346897 RepID=UPI00369918F5